MSTAGSALAVRATKHDSGLRGAESRRLRVRSGFRLAVATVIAIIVGGSSSVLACPVCFGAEETSMIDGTKLGILVMLGLTVAVQGAFAGFFLYLRRRAKRIAEMDLDAEWAHLQRGSRTSS